MPLAFSCSASKSLRMRMFIRVFKEALWPSSQHCLALGVRNMKGAGGREEERKCMFLFAVYLGENVSLKVSSELRVFLKEG